MSVLTLVIGNKNYSSWSLRPWLLLAQSGLEFEEVRVPLRSADFAERLRGYSPAGKVPALRHGALAVWDSLAICEYLADAFPEILAWPRSLEERALARAVSAEMHSGFGALRSQMPMNVRAKGRHVPATPALEADIARVCEIWRECRALGKPRGPFLFGDFTIADAMFAPVAFRFASYGVTLGGVEAAYAEALRRLPPMLKWAEAAAAESEVLEGFELGESVMLRLYDYLESGNGYKVRLLLTQLGIPFERVELDILKGATRTAEFLKKNPNGRIPCLELEDGSFLWESNAIQFYLAEGTPFLPGDRVERARVLQWLFFEQYSHEPYIAVVRFWHHAGMVEQNRAQLADKVARGYAALGVMESHLATRAFFVGERYSIVDIALYAYTHVAGEGEFELARFPAVERWLARVRSQPKHVPITQG